MPPRRSHLDLAIDKLTDEIKVLELARARLIAERTEHDRNRRKPKRPQPVAAKAANE
jgi:hypothetical protein